MNLKETLNLPDPEFTIPMRANLAELEPKLQSEWAAMGIYEAIQRERAERPTFVLHDGPPYTNSPIHIGTALNKILKVGSSRVDLQACKLEYSIVSPK